MQSSAVAFSPSLSLSTHRRKLLVRGFNPLSAPSSVRQHFSNGFDVFSSTRSLGPITCSLKQNGWVSGLNPGIPEPESDGFVVRAAAETVSPEESPKSKGLAGTLVLGTLFGLWYLFNIYFNIYNKQVLKAFHYPVPVTLVQFAVGTVLVTTMWTLNLYKWPKISGAQLVAILPLALVHTLGNLFTNMSLGKVAVSFIRTIKAMEPFFSVVLEFPTLWVVSSLVPIVGGVGLASTTEASINWAGFWSAMASNLTNQSHNVLSKKFMVKKEVDLFLDSVKWDDKGLAVAIAQNVDTGAVLMQGFVNKEALLRTLSSRKATFYSRSRSSLWTKGETSMNFINVCDVFIDCDRDSILYLRKPDGPTCHTGAETCYYTSVNEVISDSQVDEDNLALTTLYSLESTISKRKEELSNNTDGKLSWTKRLLLDEKLLCSKIREEADELCRTLEENEDKSRTASEMADVLYHGMVLLAQKGVKVEDVLQVLRLRFAQSGVEEKNSRKSK